MPGTQFAGVSGKTHLRDRRLSTMTEIVLLRHGETKWDRLNRLHGHAPVPLTAAGRESVESVSRNLTSAYDFDRVHAAKTRAARETVSLVRLAGVEPRPQIESAWRPRDAGVLQGLPYEDLAFTDRTKAPPTDVDVLPSLPRDGESLPDARDRVLTRWRRLCETAADAETVLVVTHDFPIATILGAISNADPVNGLGEYAPAQCSITAVRLTSDEPTVTDTDLEHGRIVNG
jgi:broad specificity phosphatase PhoE